MTRKAGEAKERGGQGSRDVRDGGARTDYLLIRIDRDDGGIGEAGRYHKRARQ